MDEPDDRFSAVLRPVRAGSGFEEALERLLQVLRLGLVPYGERLPPERELAQRLGISRVTLREVLKVLQDEGLLESRRGRYGGTFVRYRAGGLAPAAVARGGPGAPGPGELEDLLRFREVLETGAAQLCAARGLHAREEASLRGALAATVDAPLGDYRRLDTLLHLRLAQLSGSPSLRAAYAGVRAAVNDALDRIPLLVRNLERSQAEHAALVEAVVAGEPDRARERMRVHCEGTASLLRGFLL